MKQTCATCRHARPLHPRWLKYGAQVEDCIHCGAWRVPTASIIRRDSECLHNPSRWEPTSDGRG